MTRDRESLHVAAATDADAAVALVMIAMTGGVHDEYPEARVTVHEIDGPGIWTEVTYTARSSLWQRIGAWMDAPLTPLVFAGWFVVWLVVFIAAMQWGNR